MASSSVSSPLPPLRGGGGSASLPYPPTHPQYLTFMCREKSVAKNARWLMLRFQAAPVRMTTGEASMSYSSYGNTRIFGKLN